MSDATTRARKIRQFFPVARDEMQRAHPWNFCTAWIAPARDPVASIGPLVNRFALPADCLGVRSVRDAGDDEWAVETAQADVAGVPVEVMILVTNLAAPTVCIARRVTNVRLWDAMFLPAFGYLLASYLATSFGKSRQWGVDMRQAAMAKAAEAETVDSKEARARTRPETSWSAARRGGGFYNRSGLWLR